jgi:hypothetical protein
LIEEKLSGTRRSQFDARRFRHIFAINNIYLVPMTCHTKSTIMPKDTLTCDSMSDKRIFIQRDILMNVTQNA